MSVPLIARQVIEWLPDAETGVTIPQLDRLVWVGPAGSTAFLVDVNRDGALPRATPRDEIEQAITACRARILPTDPFSFLLQPESAYTEAQRKHRDQRYALIKPIVDAA